MPAPTTSDVNGAAYVKPAKHFELPALDLKFGSLTEGTDIPPPQPSPVLEVPTPPKTPTKDVAPVKEETNVVANGRESSPKSEITSTTSDGLKRPAEEHDGPVSPTLSSRGSLRRLISRTLLNTSYDEQASVGGVSRPPSRTVSITAEEKKTKRGSWFRHLRSNDPANKNKRNSTFMTQFEEPITKKPAGPPPPMIPEMSAWHSKVDVGMGDDLFKEIK